MKTRKILPLFIILSLILVLFVVLSCSHEARVRNEWSEYIRNVKTGDVYYGSVPSGYTTPYQDVPGGDHIFYCAIGYENPYYWLTPFFMEQIDFDDSLGLSRWTVVVKGFNMVDVYEE